ncbi:hypothetical protein RclHR1_26580002 [Rhizophagus clarus]|uniref:Uncharacterized protein n=1 Tax=Rhizophagus clarus TaxID=94130 RepID=A0A2Z6RVH7_9GLOM|nr:hypothetical protein RclHR1_26580002 [Rhizophagus clarus]
MSYEEYDNAFIYGAYSDSSPSSSNAEEASSSISVGVNTTLPDGSKKKNKNKQPVSPPQPAVPAIVTTDAQIASWCIQYEQHVLALLDKNFQHITSDTAQQQGKRLIKTFGSTAEPVKYKDISRKTNIPNTLVSLIIHSGLRIFEAFLHQPDFFQKISSNLEEKVGGPVADGISRDIQNPVNSDDSHLVTQPILPELGISQPATSSKSPIMPEQRPSTADIELINVNMENANDDTTIPSQPSSSSNTTAKSNKKQKVTDKSVDKIFVNTNIPDDKVNNIRDIFVYDVPSSWSHEKILAELKAWGDPISMTVKKQRKYQTLRIKICLSTFALASFEQEIWQYSLSDISVRGKASIVVFFEKYDDVEICRRTRFNFNHNNVDYSLPWCSAPLTASQTSKSKNSSGSSKASKIKDSSKKSKNSCSSKTHLANSKPNKEKTKTSKKSTDKKKKKSSGKKADDKMDIVKLLLTLISKF